jgi:hypothetical protein
MILPVDSLNDENSRGDHSKGSPLLHYSTLFKGKVLCNFCGLPFPRSEVTDQGVCNMCATEFKQGMTALSLMADGTMTPSNRFNEVIKELKQKTGPATVGVAEAFLEQCADGGGDGAQALGKMMADDLKLLRKDHIQDPQAREFATADADWKTIKGMYDIILKFLGKRDEMLKDASPGLETMEEEDLLAIVSEAALLRLEADEEFRTKIIEKVVQLEPDQVEQALGFWKYGLPRPGVPSVRVQDVH